MLLQLYSHYGVGYYCRLFGKSRQAFYEQGKEDKGQGLQDAVILKMVADIRQDLPRCGTEKLLFMLQENFAAHGIKMGRDGLFKLLGRHGLLVRWRSRRPQTTDSRHPYRKYPNLIRGMELTAAGQLWVSDITYLRKNNGFSYLSIITDAYSHKIVGYNLHPTLHAAGAVNALSMAALDVKKTVGLVHHSDRGIQYCCAEYVAAADHYHLQLSMTENGDPYENAIAERINGILKHEHGLKATFANHAEAATAVQDAVKKYNEKRVHDSCGRLTPIMAHEQQGELVKFWKPKVYKKRPAAAGPG